MKESKNIINMSDCFQGCTSLTTIPEDLEFSNVTTLNDIFSQCTHLGDNRKWLLKQRRLKLDKVYGRIKNR